MDISKINVINYYLIDLALRRNWIANVRYFSKSISVFVVCLLYTGISSRVFCEENADKWRTTTADGKAHLYTADSDSTDAFGRISLSCNVGSGNVVVAAQFDEPSQAKFGEIFARNEYPKIVMSSRASQEDTVISKLTFDELYDWKYEFLSSSSGKVLKEFAKTGEMKIVLYDSIVDKIEMKNGIDAIAKFLENCTKKSTK